MVRAYGDLKPRSADKKLASLPCKFIGNPDDILKSAANERVGEWNRLSDRAGLEGSDVSIASNPDVISRLDAGGVAGRASTTIEGISECGLRQRSKFSSKRTLTLLVHPLSASLLPQCEEPTAMGDRAQQRAHAIIVDIVSD